jgi:hypothetical protein
MMKKRGSTRASTCVWIASCKRSQVGVEYLIVVGFITFAILSILTVAFFYSNRINDQIRLNQIESFATQVINSAENVFFAGEPSKTTISLYLPEGVQSIEVNADYIFITTTVSTTTNKRAYNSNVPLQGGITNTPGIKKITLEAKQSYVLIS